MPIRLATFNLYQYAEPPRAWYEEENIYSQVEWQVKRDWIKKQLEGMGADVVGFQEVFSPESLKSLVEDMGYSHWTVVEQPKRESDETEVFVSPIVAMASKFPIIQTDKVSIESKMLEDLSVKEDFKFSREPIKATVLVEGLGTLVVYVTHLKSKRPLVSPPEFSEDTSWEIRVRETMRARSRGQIGSLLQRGAEAALIYQDVTELLSLNKGQAVTVLGDLNDGLDSIVLEALTNRGRIFEIDGVNYRDLPAQAKKATYEYRLYNTFDLAPNSSGEPQKPTHYYKGKGSVLDYVLVSNSLNPENPQSKGRVVGHKTLNEHLLRDGVGNQKQSDHAQVVAEIEVM